MNTPEQSGGLPPELAAALGGAQQDPNAAAPTDPAAPDGSTPPVMPPRADINQYDPAPLLQAVTECAQRAQLGNTLAQDAKDLGQAALAFAQTAITLDPTRLMGGDTPGARVAATPPVTDRNHDGVIGKKPSPVDASQAKP